MKIHRSLVMSGILTVTCLLANTTVDYNHKTNFASYHTYSWIGVNVQEPLWKDRIMSAVDSQLTAKGWQKVASGGEAAVSAVGATHNQQTVDTFYGGTGGFGGGWGHRGWWGGSMGGIGMSTSEVENTPVGTLHIDIFDGAAKNVIWHAAISDTLSSKPEKNEDKMRKAVADAFKKFPPKEKD
jgi:Domain of unknown function (DUF4136)